MPASLEDYILLYKSTFSMQIIVNHAALTHVQHLCKVYLYLRCDTINVHMIYCEMVYSGRLHCTQK